MNRIFITGMGRSGTTLLDKLLTNHSDVEILSQPFPLLFTEIKKAFLETLGISKYYVLNDNCFNGDYTIENFNNFLEKFTIDYSEIIQLFKRMESYSGQMTKVKLDIKKQEHHTFLDLYDGIIQTNLMQRQIKYFGSKEIMCEEFIPFLLKNETKVVIIIRDPRDVVSSVNYPKKKYLGSKKPILFILESWRRTLDYIDIYKKNENLFYVKYEDLTSNPYETLNQITSFLKIDPFASTYFDNGIYDRDGNLWKANSSFDTEISFISSQSVGGYKEALSKDEIMYIETTCKKEMELMGYSLYYSPNKAIISEYRDYDIEDSKKLDKNYTSLKKHILKEIERYEES